MTAAAVRTLTKKRAEILADLARAERRSIVLTLQQHLACLDGTLALIAPPHVLDRLRRQWPSLLPRRRKGGGLGCLCLDVLREAGRPLTVDEVAQAVCERRGLVLKAAGYRRLRRQVYKALWDKRRRGLVDSA